MRAVRAEVLEVVFAAAVVVLFGSAALLLRGRLSRTALLTLAWLVAAVAAAAWVVVALEPARDAATAAVGITVCAAAQAGLLVLRRLLEQGRALDDSLAAARDELDAVVKRETETRAAELERTLALARSQSLSRLAEEERRMAEKRRAAVHEREQQTNAELSEALAKAQARIGARLADWAGDLERTEHELTAQIASLRQRQEQLLADAATRLTIETERLDTASEEQRERLAALATQFDRVARETAESAHTAIETHESERRRALQQVAERLRERERELRERIAAEESEAAQRIQAGFADTERRQVDQLKRIVERTSGSFSEALSRQFTEEIKRAREEAAQRLSRELDKAVAHFSREAQSVLAERLAHVADAGGQRLERKLSQIGSSLEQEQSELAAELQKRIGDTELELRSQVQGFAADAEAERSILSARLNELQRRLEALRAEAEARTPTFRTG